jgi:hypothetical protein
LAENKCDEMKVLFLPLQLGGTDLSQMLWLPLSGLEPAARKDAWLKVFLLSIQLVSLLPFQRPV